MTFPYIYTSNNAMPRTVPLWLWAEHAALLAITGVTVYDIWKSRRENKRPFHSLSQALDSLVAFFTGQPNDAAPGAKEQVASPAAGATGGTTTLADSLTAQRGVTQAQALASLPGEVLARLQAIKQLAGPKAVLSWPDVSEAPGASMDMSSVAEGEVGMAQVKSACQAHGHCTRWGRVAWGCVGTTRPYHTRPLPCRPRRIVTVAAQSTNSR